MNLLNTKKWLALILSVFVLSNALYLDYYTDSADTSDTLVINALGDSITYGSGTDDADNVYVNQVGKALGADKVNNYGLPSSPVSAAVNPALSDEENRHLSFLDRAQNMDKNADIIFVFGGVNDYSLDVPLGTEYDYSAKTFTGSLNILFNELVRNYPNSAIYVLTPIKRYDQVGANKAGYQLEDYANQICAVADNYSQVDFIDLYHASELDFTTEETQYLLVDGLHPNDEGQRKIAEYITTVLKS